MHSRRQQSFLTDSTSMSSEPNTAGIPAALMTELQEAAERAAQGVRDLDDMRRAAAPLDRLREEIRRRHGLLDVAVPALHELRDANKVRDRFLRRREVGDS